MSYKLTSVAEFPPIIYEFPGKLVTSCFFKRRVQAYADIALIAIGGDSGGIY